MTDPRQLSNGRREQNVSAIVKPSRVRTALAGTIAWLVLAGLLAGQFWPVVPTTTRGWALFVLLGPPTYLLVESASCRLWDTRAGRALSRHPSVAVRIVGGVAVLGALLTAYVGGLWLLGRSV